VSAQRRVAVIGAGWAGLAAAVQACADGAAVTLFEMASHAGGRARSVTTGGLAFDNGQHILIGAYRETLRLMQMVGVEPHQVLHRRPLELTYPDGGGLRLTHGDVRLAFARAVIGARGWGWGERWSLLRQTISWARKGMRNPGVETVAQLCAALPARVRADLIEPLCVAALNTPAAQASATVFLRVLADALFGGPGSSNLLLPMAGLSRLFPQPALEWLARQGITQRFGHRVRTIERRPQGTWSIDDECFDAAVIACSAIEAARLASTLNPEWSACAAALRYEPIATVYLRRRERPLPSPMLALRSSADRPAQFAFDLGVLGVHPNLVAFVVSGASDWLGRGLPALAAAVQCQAAGQLPASFADPPEVVHTAMERRATFVCRPSLARPSSVIASGVWAAGDYVDGPYPATIEGAVRSGVQAARAILAA